MILRNNNPFYYTIAAATLTYVCMFNFIIHPKPSIFILMVIFRRLFITANIHAMMLSNQENMFGVSSRVVQYCAHIDAQVMCLLMAFYYLYIQSHILGIEREDVEMNQWLRPIFQLVPLLMLLALPCSIYLCYEYWKDKNTIHARPGMSRWPAYMKVADWRWY